MIRSPKLPFIQSTARWPLLLSTALIIAIGLAIPFTPLGTVVLGMVPPPGLEYGFFAIIVLAYAVLVSVVKALYIRVFKTWL